MKCTDKALLAEAWDGYLRMRGVRTLGGWQCLGEDGWVAPIEHVHQHVAETLSEERLIKYIEDGDLLPAIDTSDRATWACALFDLATACGYEGDADLSFQVDRRDPTTWWLKADDIDIPIAKFGINTDNRATALVCARIQARELGDPGAWFREWARPEEE